MNIKMDEILEKIPDDFEYANDVKKYFNIDKVRVEKNIDYKTSLYNFINNKITISENQTKLDKVLVIVHEFIHAKQPLYLHFMNFILSNSEIVLFIFSLYLIITNKFYFDFGCLYFSTVTASMIVRTAMEAHAVNKSLVDIKYVLKKYINEEENKKIYSYYKAINSKYSWLFYLQLNLGKIIRSIIIGISFYNIIK